MSDVKRFTGFIAVDGSTHNTLKQATEHSREVKVKKALATAFAANVVTPADVPEHELTAEQIVPLDEFIFKNREAILAALSQQVTTRKPRTPKVKPAAAANDSQPAAA
jgi:hypothetical protein